MAQSILHPILETIGDTLMVTLMGAETLMAESMIRQLVEWVEQGNWKRKCLFFGSTNGTLLTSELKKWFFEHRKTITLGLSYDGTPHTQENNRGTALGSIDLAFFRNTWPQQKVQMTINAESVYSMAEGVIYLLEQGFLVNANVAYEAKNWPRKSLQEYYRQLRILSNYYLEHPNIEPIYQFVHSLNEYAQNIQDLPKQKQMCGAGDGFWVFDVDGRYYPCHMLSPLVLNSKQLKKLESKCFGCSEDFSDPRCRVCPFVTDCPTCIGCNFIYRGDLRKRELTHCCLMEMEVKATMKLELQKMKRKATLTLDDELLLQSITAIKEFFKKNDRHKM